MIYHPTQFFQSSSIGPTSRSNSDAAGVWKNDEYAVAVVCDGVSGCTHGSAAAHLAVATILSDCQLHTELSEPATLVESWAKTAHRKVVERFNHTGLCTLVLTIITNRSIWGAYAGDSSCQVIKKDGIATLLTITHNVSVLRMLNGSPVYFQGIPVFDQGLTKALGQAEPLVPDMFHHHLGAGDWVACFSDGITADSMVSFLTQQPVNNRTVAQFVAKAAEHSKDDATVVLYHNLSATDFSYFADNLSRYANLDPTARSDLLQQIDNTITADMVVGLQEAFILETDDHRAAQLAQLLISSSALKKCDLVKLLDSAAMRKQSLTIATVRRALESW